jgi:hypothetical protein
VSKQSIFASCLSLLLSVLSGCANNGNGGCPTPCASAEACCDGMCVFTQISQQHCGGCDMPCAGTCSNGVCLTGPGVDGGPGHDAGPLGDCRPTCASSQRCCGTSCVSREQPLNVDGRPASADDLGSTFNNCNGCGLRCDPMRHSSCSVRTGGTVPECTCGNIGSCTAPSVCSLVGTAYMCINTQTDPANCGGLGMACATGETCTAGVCGCAGGARCATGQACCPGAGCIDVSADAANCGACGTVCGENAPNCQAGVCVCGTGAGARACAAPMAGGSGFPPTPAMLGESCCDDTCVANTDTNCGCGVACNTADDETCVISGGGLPGMPSGGGGVCCGQDLFITTICTGGGGLPGLGDGGLPFP